MKFWDSSAVLPLIVEEASSDAMRKLFTKEDHLILWWGTEIECVAALARKEREGRLTSVQISCARRELKEIFYDAIEIHPSQKIKSVAERLLRTHPLHSADSLQLAAALVFSG